MSFTLTVLAVLAGIMMTVLVLMQDGKSGDLTALHGTKADQIVGVKSPVRFWTACLAALMLVLVVALNVIH
jgi:protein translocase SecG subunit